MNRTHDAALPVAVVALGSCNGDGPDADAAELGV